MVVNSTRDRRAERREATRAEILEAAWELARTQGLAGLSLRDVASKIGMRAPSLYWYFDAKNAVYDAMFAQGSGALLARMRSVDWPEDPRVLLRETARVFVEFAVEDPPEPSCCSSARSRTSSLRPNRTPWPSRCSTRYGRASRPPG